MTAAEARFFSHLDRCRELATVEPIDCFEGQHNGAAWWLLCLADGINALQGYCLQVEINARETA